MTTGRINQVTIVRRGWPPAATSCRWRDGELLVGTWHCWQRWVRPAAASSARPWAPLSGNPLPPSAFPRATPRRTASPASGFVCGSERPKRRTLRTASTMAVSTARGYPQCLAGFHQHDGHESAEPVLWRKRETPYRPEASFPDGRVARNRLPQEDAPTMLRSGARERHRGDGLLTCSKAHAVGTNRIWYSENSGEYSGRRR